MRISLRSENSFNIINSLNYLLLNCLRNTLQFEVGCILYRLLFSLITIFLLLLSFPPPSPPHSPDKPNFLQEADFLIYPILAINVNQEPNRWIPQLTIQNTNIEEIHGDIYICIHGEIYMQVDLHVRIVYIFQCLPYRIQIQSKYIEKSISVCLIVAGRFTCFYSVYRIEHRDISVCLILARQICMYLLCIYIVCTLYSKCVQY